MMQSGRRRRTDESNGVSHRLGYDGVRSLTVVQERVIQGTWTEVSQTQGDIAKELVVGIIKPLSHGQ